MLKLDPYTHWCEYRVHDMILGHLYLSPRSGYVLVEGVFIDENVRGLGYGKKMMQEALELCENNGHSVLRLAVKVKNIAAIGLYLGLDFKIVGGPRLTDRGYHVYDMELIL